MKPKPLYRSLTFWSGILVMAFIGWAWHGSQGRFSSVYGGRVEVIHCISQLTIAYGRLPIPYPLGSSEGDMPESEWISEPLAAPFFLRGGAGDQPGESPFPRTYIASQRSEFAACPADAWMISLPYWLILPTVPLPWSGLLLWRARRVRRAMAGSRA